MRIRDRTRTVVVGVRSDVHGGLGADLINQPLARTIERRGSGDFQGSAAPRAETRVRARAVSPSLRDVFSGKRSPGRGQTALTKVGA